MTDFDAKFSTDATFNASLESDDGLSVNFDVSQVVETGDYEKLSNHPSINDNELIGNKSFEDLGDHILTNLEIKKLFDKIFGGE